MPYRLFRESTRSVKGKVVKDISFLNRDPSKVIVLDVNPEHVALQPENGIVLQPWDGSPRDKGLVDMIPFLECMFCLFFIFSYAKISQAIGIFNPADVRPILQAYAGKDIPIEYAKKEAEAKAKAIEEWERTHPTAITGAGSGFLSSIFGSVAAVGLFFIPHLICDASADLTYSPGHLGRISLWHTSSKNVPRRRESIRRSKSTGQNMLTSSRSKFFVCCLGCMLTIWT